MEDELRRLVNVLPGLVWTALPNGHVDFLNQRWCEYTGLSADEALRRGWQAAIHPADLPRVLELGPLIVASGQSSELEARVRRFDGQYRWFLLGSCPLADATGAVVKWCGFASDIDERKRTEEALRGLEVSLRASERNLELIVNTIPALAWSARPDGLAEFFNEHYLEYMGLTQDQARGTGWASAVHPDDLPGLWSTWQRIMASEKTGEAEARLRRFDGEYRWFLFRTNPLRDDAGQIVRWYGTNTDIDDRKRAEERLRRNEAFLAEGERLNSSGSFCWRLDTDEITFSEQLHRIFELEPDAPVTPERLSRTLHPEDLPLFSEKMERARRGMNDEEYEIRLCMSDGTIKYLRTSSYGTRDRDGRLEFIGAVQDVTERRLSEEALGKVRSELAHMTTFASLGALTASIAHEFNQPLSGIITNANTCLRMLASEPPNVAGARETARRTIRDGNRASDVIARLRALFAKRDIETELVDLNEATREVIALSWSELQRDRVVLRSELAGDLPAVIGDRVQLQQVILNLVLNASASMSGVDDRPRVLSITTDREEGDRVRLTMRDTGVGLDAKTIEQLVGASYTTKGIGMALGLSVIRSIVESHQGRLWAIPNDGPGATFSFSIPRAPEPVPSAPRITPTPVRPDPEALGKNYE
jgi:PAS domain S-box-containing protein